MIWLSRPAPVQTHQGVSGTNEEVGTAGVVAISGYLLGNVLGRAGSWGRLVLCKQIKSKVTSL